MENGPEHRLPRLYRDLADWFPLLTPPAEYAEEAQLYARLILESGLRPAQDVLELGSGGGHNASHLKAQFKMTLVDLSPQMLTVSRRLNPECEHVQGDMRSIRLGRLFDAVVIHDAVSYLTREEDLRAAIKTAFAHCRPGAVALFVPDYVRENFQEGTDTGGSDFADRALRYLEWRWDPDPADTCYTADMVYLMRGSDGKVQVVSDRHEMGLFPRSTWVTCIESAGFQFQAAPFEHSELPKGAHEVFLGIASRQK